MCFPSIQGIGQSTSLRPDFFESAPAAGAGSWFMKVRRAGGRPNLAPGMHFCA
jgi:hypothetical protein